MYDRNAHARLADATAAAMRSYTSAVAYTAAASICQNLSLWSQLSQPSRRERGPGEHTAPPASMLPVFWSPANSGLSLLASLAFCAGSMTDSIAMWSERVVRHPSPAAPSSSKASITSSAPPSFSSYHSESGHAVAQVIAPPQAGANS
jgi:hypothetical protein